MKFEASLNLPFAALVVGAICLIALIVLIALNKGTAVLPILSTVAVVGLNFASAWYIEQEESKPVVGQYEPPSDDEPDESEEKSVMGQYEPTTSGGGWFWQSSFEKLIKEKNNDIAAISAHLVEKGIKYWSPHAIGLNPNVDKDRAQGMVNDFNEAFAKIKQDCADKLANRRYFPELLNNVAAALSKEFSEDEDAIKKLIVVDMLGMPM